MFAIKTPAGLYINITFTRIDGLKDTALINGHAHLTASAIKQEYKSKEQADKLYAWAVSYAKHMLNANLMFQKQYAELIKRKPAHDILSKALAQLPEYTRNIDKYQTILNNGFGVVKI